MFSSNNKKYMKRNMAFALIFIFIFSLAINLPVKAEEERALTATTTLATTSAPLITNFKDIKPEDRAKIDTSKLEKIPSPEYIRYFSHIIKKEGVMYGVRIEHKATATEAIKKTEERKATSSLEKIPSPDHVKFFEKITKIGNALFGIKKEGIKATTTIATNLEKITSLDQVKLFDKVTKIGNDLFGMRKNTVNKLPEMSTTTIACVSAAIDAKDNGINIVLSVSAADVLTSITVRGTCQKAALNLTDTRQEAVNACNKTFSENVKKVNESTKERQKTIWDTYTKALKECSTKNTNGANIIIEDGGQNSAEILKQ